MSSVARHKSRKIKCSNLNLTFQLHQIGDSCLKEYDFQPARNFASYVTIFLLVLKMGRWYIASDKADNILLKICCYLAMHFCKTQCPSSFKLNTGSSNVRLIKSRYSYTECFFNRSFGNSDILNFFDGIDKWQCKLTLRIFRGGKYTLYDWSTNSSIYQVLTNKDCLTQ